MTKLLLIAAGAALLSGCAAGGGMYAPPPGTQYHDPYRSYTGSPYDWSAPFYDDRYWPPVDPNSSFPPQIMDGGSKGN